MKHQANTLVAELAACSRGCRVLAASSTPVVAFNSMFLPVLVTGAVMRLQIVRDEGTTLSGNAELGFERAVLDNINVNGVHVGQGPGRDDDEDNDRDDEGDSPKDCGASRRSCR